MRNKSKCKTKQPNPRSFFLPWVGKGSSRLLDCKLTQKHLSGSREQAVPFPEPRFHSVQRGQVSKRIGNPKGPLEIHTSLPNTSHPDLPLPTSLVSFITRLYLGSAAPIALPLQLSSDHLPCLSGQGKGLEANQCSEHQRIKLPRHRESWHLHSYSLKARAAEDLETLKASGLLP